MQVTPVWLIFTRKLYQNQLFLSFYFYCLLFLVVTGATDGIGKAIAKQVRLISIHDLILLLILFYDKYSS